jgi:hypothetical protein
LYLSQEGNAFEGQQCDGLFQDVSVISDISASKRTLFGDIEIISKCFETVTDIEFVI